MNDTTPYGSATGLYRRLKQANAADWRAYTWHPFVQGLADGSLPLPAFKRYLVQDYLFLVQFVRAFALAAYKAESLAAFREKAGAIQALLHEMTLHVGYCAEWGIAEDAILAEPEAAETVAYTRWVLDRGIAGDILDLEVALAPCTAGYGEIALAIEASPTRRHEGNPYESWIAMYAGDEYQALARGAAARLDTLGESHGGAARFAALSADFAKAARLEADFWQMGLRG
ncbi:thiaminase II [Falsiroseomonas bella]|uniref:Thiaminase II n=1 Tax=Falsiroseomonas bella TaxID=2184016 RepID=A0A317FFC3_9PROT|nr:TenA family protein [Falsiroseomonas bella]PWS37794.1 thiaminase II [Falsiroseomonas bella]